MALRVSSQLTGRLWRVAWPLLTASTEMCPNRVIQGPGFQVGGIHEYEPDVRDLVAEAVGLGDTLVVTRVAAGGPAAVAGIQMGDRIISVGGEAVQHGPGAIDQFRYLMDPVIRGDIETIELEVGRGPESLSLRTGADRYCGYDLFVTIDNELNAFATGTAIVVTSGMMRFAEDDELAVIVGHEWSEPPRVDSGGWLD